MGKARYRQKTDSNRPRQQAKTEEKTAEQKDKKPAGNQENLPGRKEIWALERKKMKENNLKNKKNKSKNESGYGSENRANYFA